MAMVVIVVVVVRVMMVVVIVINFPLNLRGLPLDKVLLTRLPLNLPFKILKTTYFSIKTQYNKKMLYFVLSKSELFQVFMFCFF